MIITNNSSKSVAVNLRQKQKQSVSFTGFMDKKDSFKSTKSDLPKDERSLFTKAVDSVLFKAADIRDELDYIGLYMSDKKLTQPSKNESLILEEKKAAEMGVKASYGDSYYFAKTVNESLKDFKDAGYPLPKEILNFESDTDFFGPTPSLLRKCDYIGTTYPSKKTVSLNVGFPWGRMPEFMSDMHSKGITSTANPKHFIYQKLASVAHDINDHKQFKTNERWEFDPSETVLIRKKVGKLASKEINNFISEVFVAMLDGKVYEDKIMDLYHQFGGIKVIGRLKP